MAYQNRFQKGMAAALSAIVSSIIYISPAFAQPGRWDNGGMGRWMMGGWGMGWFGMLFMIVFWGLAIAGIIFLVRWLLHTTSGRAPSDVNTGSQAMAILEKRYACGEITRDQFESMRKDILQ